MLRSIKHYQIEYGDVFHIQKSVILDALSRFMTEHDLRENICYIGKESMQDTIKKLESYPQEEWVVHNHLKVYQWLAILKKMPLEKHTKEHYIMELL